jgi:shikimate dehydrogenase
MMQSGGPLLVCAVIADPVAQSLSPAMHNAAFRHCRLPFVYVAWRVVSEKLAAAVAGIAALGVRGVNVTLPHKEAVVPLLHLVDERARVIGAVNTIVNDNGVLRGYNTDPDGFVAGLLEHGIEVRDQRVLLLGAGGAAKAAAYALANLGARLTILNRTPSHAYALAERTRRLCTHSIETQKLTNEHLASFLPHCDIVVNATSIGMWPKTDISPVPCHLLRRNLVVYDLVYRPRATRLLTEAQAVGADVIAGVTMLVEQGTLAFTMWTGAEAPRAVMRAAVEQQLVVAHEE